MTTIVLENDVSIKNIKIFYQQISRALDTDSGLLLDFSNVKRADLSLLQVIMSANREFAKQGKKFLLKSVSENVKEQMHLCRLVK